MDSCLAAVIYLLNGVLGSAGKDCSVGCTLAWSWKSFRVYAALNLFSGFSRPFRLTYARMLTSSMFCKVRWFNCKFSIRLILGLD